MSCAAFGCLAWLVAASAVAQDNPCPGIEAGSKAKLEAVLATLYVRGCLGRDNDADQLTARVGSELKREVTANGVRHSADEQKMVVVWTLDMVHEALEGAGATPDSPAAAVLRSMIAKVEQTQAAVLDAPPQEKSPANAVYWQWNTGTGRFPGAVPGAEKGVSLTTLYRQCADENGAACREAYEAGKLALRAATLVERAFTFQARPLLEEARLEAARRNRMWHAYFEQARVQLPLELAINSFLYRRKAKSEAGFAEAPAYQVIFLHPSAGLQYVGAADAGSRFEPAMLLEVAGLNGWRWKADGSMSTAIGASFVVSYSDRAGVRGPGAGVALHVNNRYSFAFTRHGGRLGISFSTDLARFFTKAGDQVRAGFRLGK